MTPQLSRPSDLPDARPVAAASIGEAQALATRMVEVMESLLEVVERETELVRGGHLAEAITLKDQKGDLSRSYGDMIEQLKHSRTYLAENTPDLLAGLHRHHDMFRSILQVNLTVLATAHAVSEGIVRGVNAEVQLRNIPDTYTAAGRRAKPGARNVIPIVVNRSL